MSSDSQKEFSELSEDEKLSSEMYVDEDEDEEEEEGGGEVETEQAHRERLHKQEMERLGKELERMGEDFVIEHNLKDIGDKPKTKTPRKSSSAQSNVSEESEKLEESEDDELADYSSSEVEEDDEDDRPSSIETPVTIVQPKNQKNDIILPGVKSTRHKRIGPVDDIVVESLECSSEDEEEEKKGNSKANEGDSRRKRSRGKTLSQQMQSLDEISKELGIYQGRGGGGSGGGGGGGCGGTGGTGGDSCGSGFDGGKRRKLRPACWWCLFGDREIEKTSAEAYELFLESYNRYIDLPKTQLAKLLQRIWHKIIFIPSMEEGKEIPMMTEQLFYDHLMFHNKDPKSAQMDILEELQVLRLGLAENFWTKETVIPPDGMQYDRHVPDYKRIETYLKVITKWEGLVQKDVTGWMGAKNSTVDGIEGRRKFTAWGSMKTQTDKERRQQRKNENGPNQSYRGRKFVLDGDKN